MVNQSDPLTLTVKADGTPQFTYQWYRDKRQVPQSEGGAGANVKVSTDRGGVFEYEAQVSNAASSAQTESYEITVNAPPSDLRVLLGDEQASLPDGPIEVRQYDPLTLTVEAESLLPVTYLWYRDGNPLSEEEGGKAAKVTVPTDRPGRLKYHAQVFNNLGDAQTRSYDILITLCPGRIFQDQAQRSLSPTEECSLTAALNQMHVLDRAEDWQLRAIALSHAVLGETDEAFRILSLIREEWLRTQTQEDLSHWFANMENFDLALQRAPDISHPASRVRSLTNVASKLSNAGDERKAKALFSDAIRIATELERSQSIGGVARAVVVAQARTGDFSRALENGKLTEFPPTPYHLLVRVFGSSDTALPHFSTFPHITVTRTRNMWNHLIDEAIAFIDDAFVETTDIRTNMFRSLVLIARVQARVGDARGSRITFAKALEAAGQIDPLRDRLLALREIALSQSRAGDIAGANHILTRVKMAMSNTPTELE